jgi:NADH:ubiquinone oxidoreductase subunit 3 (subunit A)
LLADDYLPVILFVLIGIFFPAATFFLTRFFRSNKHEHEKEETYECGELPEGDARIQFNFQYYIFALIFVVFDVIVVFLIGWALVYASLSPAMRTYSLVAVMLFTSMLLLVVYYSIRKERKIWI